jgi:hypothetical protein
MVAKGCQHSDREQVSCFSIQTGPGPDRSPGSFCDEALKVSVKFRFVGFGTFNVRFTENGFTNLHTFFVLFVRHYYSPPKNQATGGKTSPVARHRKYVRHLQLKRGEDKAQISVR